MHQIKFSTPSIDQFSAFIAIFKAFTWAVSRLLWYLIIASPQKPLSICLCIHAHLFNQLITFSFQPFQINLMLSCIFFNSFFSLIFSIFLVQLIKILLAKNLNRHVRYKHKCFSLLIKKRCSLLLFQRVPLISVQKCMK